MTSLPALSHVDTQLGLYRTGGCLPLYLRFLVRFPEDDSLPGLLAALEQGDVREAFRCAHALKGLCTQLGIVDLGETASVICELLRPLDPSALPEARKRTQALCALHEQVCRELSAL